MRRIHIQSRIPNHYAAESADFNGSFHYSDSGALHHAFHKFTRNRRDKLCPGHTSYGGIMKGHLNGNLTSITLSSEVLIRSHLNAPLDGHRDMLRSHILFKRHSLLERASGVDGANELFVVNQLAVKR